MGSENLIPLTTRPKGEHRLIAQKGGQTKGITKTNGQKLRWIRQRMREAALTDDDAKWIMEQVENRNMAGIHLLLEARKLKDSIHPAQRVSLLNTEISALKFIHGEKIKTENTNLNINITREMSKEEIDELNEMLAKRRE